MASNRKRSQEHASGPLGQSHSPLRDSCPYRDDFNECFRDYSHHSLSYEHHRAGNLNNSRRTNGSSRLNGLQDTCSSKRARVTEPSFYDLETNPHILQESENGKRGREISLSCIFLLSLSMSFASLLLLSLSLSLRPLLSLPLSLTLSPYLLPFHLTLISMLSLQLHFFALSITHSLLLFLIIHWQVVKNPGAGHESPTDFPFTRIISEDYPTLEYRRRQHEVKTVIHWGQRKLLMSEIEFLTLYSRPEDIVVYAGAAPGTHIPFLIDLFPQLSFVLVDPAPFSAKLRENERVVLCQECFTDEFANEYVGLSDRLLFVCDVRSCDPNIMSNVQVEQHVLEDMEAQMRWHKIMRPRRSMLKFRLPWRPGKTTYLDGQVFLPVWGPITTTEARLITPEHSVAMCEYDNIKYEQQMFFFNTRGRVARYQHVVDTSSTAGEGLDFCYDCCAEVHILQEYLRKCYSSPCELHGKQFLSSSDPDSSLISGPLATTTTTTTTTASHIFASASLSASIAPVSESLPLASNSPAISTAPVCSGICNSAECARDMAPLDLEITVKAAVVPLLPPSIAVDQSSEAKDHKCTAHASSTCIPAASHSSISYVLGADPPGIARQIAHLSRTISRKLGGDRTLLSENSDPEERLKFIRSKQWIKGAPAYAPQLQPTADVSMSAIAQKMMANMNYVAGAGLGVGATGAVEPVSAKMEVKQNTFGLGYVSHKRMLPPAAENLKIEDTAAVDEQKEKEEELVGVGL